MGGREIRIGIWVGNENNSKCVEFGIIKRVVMVFLLCYLMDIYMVILVGCNNIYKWNRYISNNVEIRLFSVFKIILVIGVGNVVRWLIKYNKISLVVIYNIIVGIINWILVKVNLILVFIVVKIFIFFVFMIIGDSESVIVIMIFGMINRVIFNWINSVLMNISSSKWGKIGIEILIVCNVLIWWFWEIIEISVSMLLINKILFINVEKVVVVDILSRIICCFGVSCVINFVMLRFFDDVKLFFVEFKIFSCLVLGIKVWFSMMVMNVVSSVSNRMVVSWLCKKLKLLWYKVLVVIGMKVFWDWKNSV